MPLSQTSIFPTVEHRVSTAVITMVAATTTSEALLAPNPNRKGVIVVNNSAARLYLALALTASSDAFTVPLDPGDYWEFLVTYPGIISGIWTAATGGAMITEFS